MAMIYSIFGGSYYNWALLKEIVCLMMKEMEMGTEMITTTPILTEKMPTQNLNQLAVRTVRTTDVE
jgi:hypothetical protein